MNNSRDDIIEDLLVNSDLAKKLVPNKFKFTSQQERIRRQKLLSAAKKLSETHTINDITLADVCEEADIPRASAYHFFPNVEAVFLALRFLNAIEIIEELKQVDVQRFDRWQGYITGLLNHLVEVLNNDISKAKLIYEANAPEFGHDTHGERVEHQVVNLVYEKLASQYEVPEYESIKEVLLIGYSIINGVLMLAYRTQGTLTDDMKQEAITAGIAYLRCYLPEKFRRKAS